MKGRMLYSKRKGMTLDTNTQEVPIRILVKAMSLIALTPEKAG